MIDFNQISQEKEAIRKLYAPLGFVSGKIGSVVCRIYTTRKNGKIVKQQRIATLPKSFKTNRRHDLEDNRYQFKSTALFARQINSTPQLKQLWKIAAKGKHSAYNYINKINYPFSSPEGPTLQSLLVPSETKLQLQDIKVTPYAITGSLPYKKNSLLIALISFSKPYSKQDADFKLMSVSLPVNGDKFTIPVNKQIKELALNYKKFTLFFTIISETGETITSAGNFSLSGISSLFITIKLNHFNNNCFHNILSKAVGDDIILNTFNSHKPRGDTLIITKLPYS